jgi:ribosome maturation factor RimP
LAQEASARIVLANLEKIVSDAVAALSLEVVEVERARRGLLRIYIDRPEGAGSVTVDDCQAVSNQLTHVFTVENIDYDRLEVSSPGLDRVLKSTADFVRFRGLPVRVRLNELIDGRKRFDGVAVEVDGQEIVFSVQESQAASAKPSAPAKSRAKSSPGKNPTATQDITVRIALSQIERARLIPQI